jgi:hypothetical protein
MQNADRIDDYFARFLKSTGQVCGEHFQLLKWIERVRVRDQP